MNQRYISQAAAAKLCGVDRSRFTQLKNQIVPPSFFVMIKDQVSGEMVPRVDVANPEFKAYQSRKEQDEKINSSGMRQRLILTVIDFLREDLGFSGDKLKGAVKNLQQRFEGMA